jgi:hypothetical protein
MSIEPLSPAVRDYFRAFDLTAIAMMRDGCVTAKRNSAGAAAAWWCEAVTAGPVIREARRNPSAARAFGVAILSRAGHSFIFQSWSKRTTSNEAKNNTYA